MNDNDKKGFSGFDSLLSDVDPEEILKNAEIKSVPDTEPEPAPISEYKPSKNNKKAENGESFFGPKAKWLFGTIAVLVFIGIIADENSSTSTYNPSSYQAKPSQTHNSYTPNASSAPSVSEPAAIETPPVPASPTVQNYQTTPSPVINNNASFDCSTAKSTLEILICSDSHLSSLDRQVGNLYGQAREDASGNQAIRDTLLSEQRDFLKNRLEVCKIPYKATLAEYETKTIINCLINQYDGRLQILQNQISYINNDSAGENEISPEIKASVSGAAQKFFNVIKESGVGGVKAYVDRCYMDAPSYENVLVYCMTFDAVASGVIPAIEKDNNYPLTPEFENSVYQARVRKRLAAAGITDPYEQANIIAGIEREAGKAIGKIADELQRTGQ